MQRWGRLIPLGAALPIFAAISGPASATPSGLVYEKLVITGDPAPATGPGVVISGFTGGYTHPEPGPRTDAAGRVAFFAHITGPGVTSANGSGIWSQVSGQLALDVRAGQQAPGAAPGVLFRAFTEDFAPSAPAFGDGRTGLSASLTGSGISSGNDSGIWARGPGGVQLVARSGSQAPGVPAGVLFANPLYLADASDAGHLLVAGSLTGPGVSNANDEGFWSDRSGSPALVLREGQQAPGTQPGVVFGSGEFIGSPYTFPIVQFNEVSRLAVQGNLVGQGVDTFSNEALFAERSGQLTMIMREGNPAPGAGGGATFGGNSVTLHMYTLTFNTLGQVAFDVMLGGSRHGQIAIYSDHRGTLAPVVLPGDPAPGTNEGFGIYVAPILSDAGRIAFRASLSGAGSYPPLGIWWDQPGELSALVVPGDQVPGRPPGVTFAGVHWIDGFTAAGQLAFRGSVSDPSGGTTIALVLAGPGGDLRIVARGGEPFDVAGDGSDMRTVGEITSGGLSENGVLVFRLDFADGTSGIFTASLPRAPGASGGLHVDKDGDDLLRLTWNADCGGGSHYGIYRGNLAAGLSSMAPEAGSCAVSGTMTSIPAGAGTAEFFLVVPSSGGFEGSYGVDSEGLARPQPLGACYPQGQIDSCAP